MSDSNRWTCKHCWKNHEGKIPARLTLNKKGKWVRVCLSCYPEYIRQVVGTVGLTKSVERMIEKLKTREK